jgi:ABC-2 type transport system ATP-binding protein
VSAVVIESLTKRYGSLVAVDDVSLEIAAGELFVLLGPNGAGKTTTLEIAEGLREPDDGSVTVLGSAPGSKDVTPRVGVMPQHGDLYAGIRTDEAFRLFASFYEHPADVAELLERLDLGRVRRSTYRQLSGGEKRRLSFGLALVGRPELAFLDEPTAEMDVEGRAMLWETLRGLKDAGTTVVLTTHLLDEAERVADRVAIMNRGRLIALGAPHQLAAVNASEITLRLSRSIDTARLAAHIGAQVDDNGDATYRVSGIEADPQLVSRVTAWLAGAGVLLRSLHVGARSLEDVYLELTR